MTDTGKEAIKKTYENNENIKIIYFPLDDYFLLKKLAVLVLQQIKVYKQVLGKKQDLNYIYPFQKLQN